VYDIDSLLCDGKIEPVMRSSLLSCCSFEYKNEKYISFFIFNLQINSSRPTSKLIIFNCTDTPYVALNEWQCRYNLDGFGFYRSQPNELVYLNYECGTIVNEFVLINGVFEKRKQYSIKKSKAEGVLLQEK
jgi:hypothetical protein